MPRPVVPIALPPAAFSRAWSRAMWYGMISGVAGLIFSRERTSTPVASSSPISFCSAAGDSTTPLPIRHSAPSRRMPEGIRCSTVFLPPMTSVCPALCPPWKRATAPTRSVSRSTILPLPSSPHWAPRITTDLPILFSLESMRHACVTEDTSPSHQFQRQHADPDHHPADDTQLAWFEFTHLLDDSLPGARRGE